MRENEKCEVASLMSGNFCIFCGVSRLRASTDVRLSYHRFPKKQDMRSQWLQALEMSEEQVKPHSRVCSRHFRDGDPMNGTEVSLGKRFSSPIKKELAKIQESEAKTRPQGLSRSLLQSISHPRAFLCEITPIPHSLPTCLLCSFNVYTFTHCCCWGATRSELPSA